jgi:rod shape-determining protein MreC
MESLLTRYRNLTVLLVVVTGQLLLLAWQVKTAEDVPLIRIWAVSTVVPVARVLDDVRRYTFGSFQDYFVLVGVGDENRRLKQEITSLKMRNHFLTAQVHTADRAHALLAFQSVTPSRTLPARIIGAGTGVNSSNVFIDRGSGSGVEKGMAVVTPEGIVG